MNSDNQTIKFLLNGDPIEIECTEPSRSVLSFLREDKRCVGTKEGCAEGDCGACTVVVGELDGEQLRTKTVNACILFLAMLDGKALFTVEYLRQSNGSLHPVQQAMVDCHGSQCGFCTPGFVMSLWNKYHDYDGLDTRPSREEISNHLSGNLCRCTGYRPILDAAQVMFDLPPATFDQDPIVAALRKIAHPTPLRLDNSQATFDAPRTLQDLTALRAKKPEATLLAGCTDIGLWVNKQFRSLGDIIYLGDVAELNTIENSSQCIEIGAAVSLTDAYAAIVEHYPQLHEMWIRFASVPVRNSGTLGGNIANGSPIGDSPPWLMVLGAEVVLSSCSANRSIPLEQLYTGYMQQSMRADEVLASIRLPLPQKNLLFRCYKLSKRFDSDISAVCGAFALELNDGIIISAKVAYGGMAATVQRAPACEAALVGKRWDETTVVKAKQALLSDYSPLADMRASASYRSRTSANLLQRFYFETRTGSPLPAQQTSVSAHVEESP